MDIMYLQYTLKLFFFFFRSANMTDRLRFILGSYDTDEWFEYTVEAAARTKKFKTSLQNSYIFPSSQRTKHPWSSAKFQIFGKTSTWENESLNFFFRVNCQPTCVPLFQTWHIAKSFNVILEPATFFKSILSSTEHSPCCVRWATNHFIFYSSNKHGYPVPTVHFKTVSFFSFRKYDRPLAFDFGFLWYG